MIGGGPVHGTVLDKYGVAVPDAHVAVKWNAAHPTVHSNWIDCFHVLASVTDRKGGFKLPPWHGLQDGLSDAGMEIYVFKKGYGPPTASPQSLSQMLAQQAGHIDVDLVLDQESSSVVERLGTMKAYLPGCNRGGISNRNLVAYYRAVQEEIDALLATKDGQAIKKREEAAQAESLRTRNPRPYEQIILLSLIERIKELENASDATEQMHEAVRVSPPPAVTTIRICDSQGNCTDRAVQPRAP